MSFKKLVLLLFIGLSFILVIQSTSIAQEVVIASTSLSGAIAKAAGATEVRVLTPAEMRHPPEYELKPSDLIKFEGARLVVYGGYEKMVAKLLETSQNKNIKAIQIDTTTSPENLMIQARKAAQVLNTEKKEEMWEQNFREKLKVLKEKVTAFSEKKAVVHLQAQPFGKWVGFSVVQVIRPGELTPKAVADAIAQNPELVVDILHLPMAKVIAENAKCKYIQVINFPGIENTATLGDIFEFNSRQLIRAFQ
jgi:zinc transport system substrate-binding protein